MLDNVLHIVNRRIQFVFVKAAARKLTIEIREVFLRIFVPVDFGSVMAPLEFGGSPQVTLRSIDHKTCLSLCPNTRREPAQESHGSQYDL